MPALIIALSALTLAACTNSAMTVGEMAGSSASGAFERANDTDDASSKGSEDTVNAE
jgi:hypothetical protein